MKYIDAERLKAEIDKLIDDAPSYDDSKTYLFKVCSIIDSLQQEQPEVDLENELDEWVKYGPHTNDYIIHHHIASQCVSAYCQEHLGYQVKQGNSIAC